MDETLQSVAGRTLRNHHCSVVEIAGCGIAIEGPSGSGKTSLVFGLIEQCKLRGLDACFVCDDQALIEISGKHVIAHAPETTAGKAELRGFGIVEIEYKTHTRISVVVRLVEDAQIERMPEPETCRLLGVELPLIRVPRRHETAAARIVLAWIEQETS